MKNSLEVNLAMVLLSTGKDLDYLNYYPNHKKHIEKQLTLILWKYKNNKYDSGATRDSDLLESINNLLDEINKI